MEIVDAGYKMTEVGLIPEDWNVFTLGEIGEFKNGINKSSEAFGHGSPFVNLMNVFGIPQINKFSELELIDSNPEERKLYSLKKGDILFVRSSVKPSGVGLTTVVMDDLNNTVFSGFLIRFRPDIEIDDKFKIYCFHQSDFRNRLISSSSVSANTNINQDSLKVLKIAIPRSLTEQKAIATALSDVDALISSLDKLIEKKKAIKHGAMQELLTGKTRLAGFGNGVGYKMTEVGSIPSDWELKTLRELSVFRRGSFPQPYGLPKWYDDIHGMPFVQVYDVDDNLLLKPFTKQNISKEAQPMSVFVPKGTVVLTIQGSIGRIAITQYDCYVDRTLLIFQEFRKPIDKVYFMYMVRRLFEIEKQRAWGGTIKTITKEALAEFYIPLPPTIEEQEEIALALSAMEREIREIEIKQVKYKQIKQGMMQELLTGKTRLV